MNQRLLKLVKIEIDAECIFIYNGKNQKLDRLPSVYCKCEKVLMKNATYISLSIEETSDIE